KLILLSLAKSFKSRLIVIVETLNSFASSFELTSSLILISSIIIFCLFIRFISCLLYPHIIYEINILTKKQSLYIKLSTYNNNTNLKKNTTQYNIYLKICLIILLFCVY